MTGSSRTEDEKKKAMHQRSAVTPDAAPESCGAEKKVAAAATGTQRQEHQEQKRQEVDALHDEGDKAHTDWKTHVVRAEHEVQEECEAKRERQMIAFSHEKDTWVMELPHVWSKLSLLKLPWESRGREP